MIDERRTLGLAVTEARCACAALGAFVMLRTSCSCWMMVVVVSG